MNEPPTETLPASLPTSTPTSTPPSLEKTAFTALLAGLLSPILAHGLWLPLAHVFGTTEGAAGKAGTITAAALALGAVAVGIQRLRPERARLLSLALGGLCALFVTLALSLGAAGLLTLLLVAAAMACLVPWLSTALPDALDGLGRRHKLLTALYVLLALATVVKSAQVSIFMGDATRIDRQALPGEKFLETHSCLTAYVHAVTLSQQRVKNIYADNWWNGAHGLSPRSASEADPYRPFLLDYYAYPPTFLFIMAPLIPLEGNFAAQRALWFGLNGLLLLLGLWIMARWIEGPGSHRALLLVPLFFGSMPVLVTLQVGNFQIAVVMISVLAMIAFERERPVLGGALLAFAILSKISPGVLGIVLLAQRRFRGAAWTAGLALLFLLLSLLWLGTDPSKSFLTYTLPRLSSGEAFAFMDDEAFSILTNMAPFGVPFKLQLAGLDVGDPWRLARRLSRIYSGLLVMLAIVAVRKRGDRRSQAIVWMSLLVLAALQSPFAPAYAIIGLLWAMTLLSIEVRRLRSGLALVLLWLLLLTIPPIGLRLQTLYSLFQSALTLAVPIWLIVRAKQPPAPATA